MNINEILKNQFNLRDEQINNTIKLIDEGNTIPFIARYRKEMTGEMSDVTLREFYEKLMYLRNLQGRKEDVIRIIDEQGKLTEEIKLNVENAKTLQEVEDIYAPFKQKKRTRATMAKEKGLEGLVHNSEITGLKRVIKPEDELQLGQTINAKIINIDKEKLKIGVAIKDLEGTSAEYGYEEYISLEKNI